MNEAIAEVLRELRAEHHISQEKLADAIDSHQVYISEIENGKKTPSLVFLKEIAAYFSITLTELVRRIEDKF